jgi:hypothetical protein
MTYGLWNGLRLKFLETLHIKLSFVELANIKGSPSPQYFNAILLHIFEIFVILYFHLF